MDIEKLALKDYFDDFGTSSKKQDFLVTRKVMPKDFTDKSMFLMETTRGLYYAVGSYQKENQQSLVLDLLVTPLNVVYNAPYDKEKYGDVVAFYHLSAAECVMLQKLRMYSVSRWTSETA